MFRENPLIPIQALDLEEFRSKGVQVFVKREDLSHPVISGNKFRKLKYNMKEALDQGHIRLITFGGAYSSHIEATAFAAREFGLRSVGVIRGEELQNKWDEVLQTNPTLRFASECGMKFHCVSRSFYREHKADPKFHAELQNMYGQAYIVPGGGTNAHAVRGTAEILDEGTEDFDVIATPMGTGGTMAGLVKAARPHQTVLGFSALKNGEFLAGVVQEHNPEAPCTWSVVGDYHYGGFAKVNEELIRYINRVKEETGVGLEPIYTGKALMGIRDLVSKGHFKWGTKILLIHTGGMRGIKGLNDVLKNKGLPTIK